MITTITTPTFCVGPNSRIVLPLPGGPFALPERDLVLAVALADRGARSEVAYYGVFVRYESNGAEIYKAPDGGPQAAERFAEAANWLVVRGLASVFDDGGVRVVKVRPA